MRAVRFVAILVFCVVLATVAHRSVEAQHGPAQEVYRKFSVLQKAMQKLAEHEFASLTELAETPAGFKVLLNTVGKAGGDQRPAILVLGSVDPAHLAGSYLALESCRKLLDHPDLDQILDRVTFYFIPRPSPDATERNLVSPFDEVRTNKRPFDDDRDDRIDEDGPEDLNNDQVITQMRVEDPTGEWMEHPDDPRVMIKADRTKNEKGRYKLYSEGVDNDGDEAWNEDGVGGVNFDRNFPWEYADFASDAGSHGGSEVENRAVMDFAFDHPEIALVFCFTPDGNLEHAWKPNPQAEGKRIKTTLLKADAPYFDHLVEARKELQKPAGAPKPGTAQGSFLEWAYFHYGRWAFGARGWWIPDVKKTDEEKAKEDAPEKPDENAPPKEEAEEKEEALPPGHPPIAGPKKEAPNEEKPKAGPRKKEEKDKRGEDDIRDLKWLNEKHYMGFAGWEMIDHPDFPDRKVEVGGFYPRSRLNPPVEELESLVDLNVEWLTVLADKLPRIALETVSVTDLGEGLYRFRLRAVNNGYLPTESAMGGHSRQLQRLQVDLELPETAELLSEPRRRGLKAIEGNGGSAEEEWLVRFTGPVPDVIVARLWAPHVGTTALSIEMGGDK